MVVKDERLEGMAKESFRNLQLKLEPRVAEAGT